MKSFYGTVRSHGICRIPHSPARGLSWGTTLGLPRRRRKLREETRTGICPAKRFEFKAMHL